MQPKSWPIHAKTLVMAIIAASVCAAAKGADARADELAKALNWQADAVPVPFMAMPPCKTPPAIDGKLEPQE